MRTFIIGSGVDADYSSALTFVEATMSGIRFDDDAPYLAIFQNHSHELPALPTYYTEPVTSGLVIGTDANHYYIFTAEASWTGSVSSGDCSILVHTEPNAFGTFSLPNWTRINNLVITGYIAQDANLSLLLGESARIESCLITDITFENTSTKARDMVFGNVSYGQVFSNCVFKNLHVNATGVTTSAATADIQFAANFLNCIIHPATFDIKVGDSGTYLFPYSTTIYNNLIDNSGVKVLQTSPRASLISNNVFTSIENMDYWDYIKDGNCMPYDFWQDLESGQYRVAEGTALKESGIDPQIWQGALNQIDHWPYEWYDAGPLYYKPNTLVFTQDNQSIVFTVNQ